MNERTIRTHGDPQPDELKDWDTISRLRIRARTADRLQQDPAVPIEVVPEKTERYPVGLLEALCEQTGRRPLD